MLDKNELNEILDYVLESEKTHYEEWKTEPHHCGHIYELALKLKNQLR